MTSTARLDTRLARGVGLAVLILAGFKLRGYLGDGLPILFDAHSHLARSWMVERSLAEASFPSWSNDWYGGFRLLEFYSPIYYWLTGGLAFITGDVISATKWLLWGGQVAAAGAMYGLIRRLSDLPWPAVLGALALLWSGQRVIVLGVIGNYPSIPLFVGIPLLLALCCGYAQGRLALGRFVGLHGLLLAGLIGSHLSNTAAILPALLACEIVLLWQGLATRLPNAGRQTLLALAASLAAALGASAFFLIPMWLDLDKASLSLYAELASPLGGSLAPLGAVVGWLSYSFDFPFARGQGMVWWLLAGGGCLVSVAHRYRAWRGFAVGLFASVVSVAVIGERSAMGLIFFIAPLAALCLQRVADAFLDRGRKRVAWLACAIVLVTTLLSPQPLSEVDPRYVPANSLSLYSVLPKTEFASRTFDITGTALSLDGVYGWSSFSPYVSGRAIPFGAFPQGAPLDHLISHGLVSQLVRDLAQSPPELSRESVDLLYLLQVEFLVDRGQPPAFNGLLPLPRASSLRLPADVGELIQPGTIQLRHASPAIFAPEVESLAVASAELGLSWPPPVASHASASPLLGVLQKLWLDDPLGQHPDPSLDVLRRAGAKHDAALLNPYLMRLGLDRRRARAERFLLNQRDVDALSGARTAAAAPPAGAADFQVTAQRESLTRVEVSARSGRAGFLRLAYSHDAEQRVSLDGQPVRHYADPLGTGIIVAFPAGEHRVVVDSSSTRSVVPGASISLMVILGLLALSRARPPSGSRQAVNTSAAEAERD